MSSVERALAEDIGVGDATTNSIVPAESEVNAAIVAKQPGVIAGLEVARLTFYLIDQRVRFDALVNDGDAVSTGETIAEVKGPGRAILTGERTALNFLGRMSGIATQARRFCDAISGTSAKILDTRKTAPNLRATDKLAVRLGGGHNHRIGLYDMVLIKDNHVDFAGSITEAVKRARQHTNLTIEVEARTLADVEEAIAARVEWIMLDNMTLADMRQAVAINKGLATLEASGNVTLETVRPIAETGVDYISVGGLTHSVQALDLSLQVK